MDPEYILKTKFVKDYANTYIRNLKGGISYSVIAPPLSGRFTIPRIVTRNLAKILPNEIEVTESTLSLFIDLDKSESRVLTDLFNDLDEMLNEPTVSGRKESWLEVSNTLNMLLTKKYQKISLFIFNSQLLQTDQNDLVHRFYHLNKEFPANVQLVFQFEEEIPRDEDTRQAYGELYPIITEHIYYNSTFSNSDMKAVMRRFVDEFNVDIDNTDSKDMLRIASNYVGFLKILIREYIKNNDFPQKTEEILKNEAIRNFFISLWSSFSENTQREIINNSDYTNEYLVNTGIKKKDGTWFSDGFGVFVARIEGEKDDLLTTHSENSLPQLLTFQELTLFNLLKDKKGEIITRDDIAKAIWKDEWADKYSDWAIAKLVSQLRKKTSAFDDIVIKTVQNEGFTLL